MDSEIPSLKWSAQYKLSRSPRSRDLPGDKILLPPSALEQLLAASSTPSAPVDPRPTSSFGRYSYNVPVPAYQSQANTERQQRLPQPLTFRLVNPSNGRIIYAGVREFSADEGEIAISPMVTHALGLEDSLTIADETEMHVDEKDGDVDQALLTVHVQELVKGTYVKLRPLEAGYDPEDWKALLEQHLRFNYTTLTNREVLTVPGGKALGGKEDDFRFLIDGFKPDAEEAICIVDTDLEVDIEALNEDQARETLARIAQKLQKAPGTEQGSSSGGDMDIFNAVQGQVLPEEYVDYQLPSWPRTSAIEVELDGVEDDDDVSLLVSPYSARQRTRPRIDRHVFADLRSRPAKRIRLEPTNAELDHAEALWISVYAYAPPKLQNGEKSNGHDDDKARPRQYTLRAQVGDSRAISKSEEQTQIQAPNPDDVQCKNCRQWVPQRTLFLHENFCLRNNALCPKGCGQVFQNKSDAYAQHWHCPLDTFYGQGSTTRLKHDAIFHPPERLLCPDCSTSQTFSSIPLLAHHRTTTCPAKSILCRFCHLAVPQGGDPDVPNPEALLSGLTQHELEDGSRTTECHLCNRIVRLRDMDTHLKHHNLERKSRPRPRLCRNANCGRTLDGVSHAGGNTRANGAKSEQISNSSSNDVGLCNTCFGPLYVSLYDPDGKALKRRVERRYLQQLLSGCGKAWCRNEYCRTGRKNAGLEDKGSSTKDALPMIRPLVDSIVANDGAALSMHFCVDETSQRRCEMAGLLAAEYERELGGRAYDLVWCLGALEAESGDLGKAREWLENWAPRRDEERMS